MTISFRLTAAAAATGLAALAAATATSFAGSPSTAQIVRPLAGLSFDVGAKHAVGYFEQKNGGCDLTLLVADVTSEPSDRNTGTVPARFRTPISAGRTARIDTGEGPSVEIFCSTGATWLKTRVIERLAYSAPAR